MMIATISVIGMSCSGCANSVEKALEAVDGVRHASVDLQGEKATVEYDDSRTKIEDLKRAVEDAGYETNPSM